MLQANTNEQKQQVKAILDLCTHVDVHDNGVHVSGHITYDQMKRVVDALKFRIRKGYLYKCKKDVYDNSGEVCLFSKGEHYPSPEDGFLFSNICSRVVWNEWHQARECFDEADMDEVSEIIERKQVTPDYVLEAKKRFAMSLYAMQAAAKDDLLTDGEFIYLDKKLPLGHLSEDDAIKFIWKLMFYGYDVESLVKEYRQYKKIRI